MKYENIVKGKFIERPNRFIAVVQVDGEETRAHVKNTGRCRELLVPGATVYLEDFAGRMGTRKMRYSLIGVEKGSLMINMDSQAPNKVVREALENGSLKLPGLTEPITLIKPEKTYGESRFDFYIEAGAQKAFAEVKGVTLEHDGHAAFPDAPTERGVKHINELISAKADQYLAYIIFVIQMKPMKDMKPNWGTHREFGEALIKAKEAGVGIVAMQCDVTEDSLAIAEEIPVILEKE